MALDATIVQTLIGRASSDPDFLRRLAEDSQGTLEAEGFNLSAEDREGLLAALGNAPDVQQNLGALAEELQPRVSHATGFTFQKIKL
jgi:hypothetical protein